MLTLMMAAMAASATAAAPPPQRYHRERTTTVEGPRGTSVTRSVETHGWYRPPPPRGYIGVRPGHFYAPGYGYYPVPPRYYGRTWAVGVYVPPPLRTYVVVDPGLYRLPPAPVGHRWIYVGNRVALVAVGSGVIVRLGPVYW